MDSGALPDGARPGGHGGSAIGRALDLAVTGVTLIAALAESPLPGGAERVVDGTGKHLIPGLIEAHAHPFPVEESFLRFVHYWVTSILIPGCSVCSPENLARARELSVGGPIPPLVEMIPVELVASVVEAAHERGLEDFAHVSSTKGLRVAEAGGADHLLHFVGVDIDWDRDAEMIGRLRERDPSWVTTLAVDKALF